MELSGPYLLSQLCAMGALGFGVAAYIQPHDKALKLRIGASAICMSVHFMLLGAWVGALLALVGATRYITSTYSRSPWLLVFFLVLGLFIGFFRYQTPSDILPPLANTLACIALFRCEGTNLRVLLLGVTACWLTYNILHASVVGATLETFYFVTNALKLLHTAHQKRTKKPA